jgi:hypothetical protein
MDSDCVTAEVKLFERGQLKAFVDVTLKTACGEITIFGFRVIQNAMKPPWVATPTISYQKDGKTVTKPMIGMPRSMQAFLTKLVLDAYSTALEVQNNNHPVA